MSECGAVAFPAHGGSWLGEHAPDVALGGSRIPIKLLLDIRSGGGRFRSSTGETTWRDASENSFDVSPL